jgi:hypothetical protein
MCEGCKAVHVVMCEGCKAAHVAEQPYNPHT